MNSYLVKMKQFSEEFRVEIKAETKVKAWVKYCNEHVNINPLLNVDKMDIIEK